VLIAGGLSGGRAVDGIDVFDPERRTVYPAGHMLSARARFTATALPDGTVLLVGGTDGSRALPSTEIYDAASGMSREGPPLGAPREGHIAIMPRAAHSVLIAGGTSGSERVDPAEIFNLATGRIEPARPRVEKKPPTGTSIVTVAIVDPGEGAVRNARSYLVP
jgi:hypothetical protein